MNYTKVTKQHFEDLKAIVGAEYVSIDKEQLIEYGHDETEDYSFPPELLVKPANANEISAILKLANAENIPVTPIGAKTGLSGGALSLYGGIGLSLERLNRILKIDEKNLQATVEPAVITQVFHDECKELGLFLPARSKQLGILFYRR